MDLRHVRNGFGVVLATDMGFGKTMQAMALVLYLKEMVMFLWSHVGSVGPTLEEPTTSCTLKGVSCQPRMATQPIGHTALGEQRPSCGTSFSTSS